MNFGRLSAPGQIARLQGGIETGLFEVRIYRVEVSQGAGEETDRADVEAEIGGQLGDRADQVTLVKVLVLVIGVGAERTQRTDIDLIGMVRIIRIVGRGGAGIAEEFIVAAGVGAGSPVIANPANTQGILAQQTSHAALADQAQIAVLGAHGRTDGEQVVDVDGGDITNIKRGRGRVPHMGGSPK